MPLSGDHILDSVKSCHLLLWLLGFCAANRPRAQLILSFSLMGALREFISAAKAAGKRDKTFPQDAAVPMKELSVTRTARHGL